MGKKLKTLLTAKVKYDSGCIATLRFSSAASLTKKKHKNKKNGTARQIANSICNTSHAVLNAANFNQLVVIFFFLLVLRHRLRQSKLARCCSCVLVKIHSSSRAQLNCWGGGAGVGETIAATWQVISDV